MKVESKFLVGGVVWGLASEFLYSSSPRLTDNLLLTLPSRLTLALAERFQLASLPNFGYAVGAVGVGVLTAYSLYQVLVYLKVIR